MHFYNNCRTIINIAEGTVAKTEKITVNVEKGTDMCLRCIAIVVNWMTGETLVATGTVEGWKE